MIEHASALLRAPHPLVLADVATDAVPGFDGGKRRGRAALAAGAAEFRGLQERLFAEARRGGTRSVLLVLQAMDTAGKGGIVDHVVGSLSPYGVQLHAFAAPTAEERAHDFLWRFTTAVPAPGRIGVFDRSHYEDVLIQRVRSLAPPEEIERRYGAIVAFEEGLASSGTALVKVMLHISADEQRDRLLARLDDPAKRWKYNPADVDERRLWAEYAEAYQIAIDRTSTDAAPWFVVPADRKWYARLAVQSLLVAALRAISPEWPAPDYDVAAEKARLDASLN